MPPSPERIGRYTVLGELGRGAMGVVYRGRDESLDRDVALKVMTKGTADQAARARFQREARAAARLQHPNIVVIYELGEHAGSPFMALEMLEGTDLQRAIEEGIRPDPRRVLPLVLQILAGLGHAHEQGIVHRDVKPSNVFLPIGRPAKIMDFGVARLAGAGVTTGGMLSGTPSYMSPEQVTSEEVDGRSDLFSVGLMLYELVTGEKAIRAESVAATFYKILHETPDLTLIPPGAGWRRLRSVLERALARRRDDRYPDARSMSADLALALAELGGTVEGTDVAAEPLLLKRRPSPAAPASPRVEPAAAGEAQPVRRPRPQAHARISPLWVGVAGLALLGVAVWFAAHRASQPAAETLSSPPHRSLPTTLALPSAPPSAAPSPVKATEPPTPSPEPTMAPLVPEATAGIPSPGTVATLGTDAALEEAGRFIEQERWEEALAAARGVLETAPTNAQATALAQQAEAEIVLERCVRNARAALRAGDRERALSEIRRGFLVRTNDPRLLELHREAVQP